jgi:hypothetical protein
LAQRPEATVDRAQEDLALGRFGSVQQSRFFEPSELMVHRLRLDAELVGKVGRVRDAVRVGYGRADFNAMGGLEPLAPKVARLLLDAEADLLAFYALPREHWSKLRSTNPLEHVNREIGRRTDVVGIFPNDAALIRLAGSMLVEQNDEWLVSRRYLSQESLALVLEDEGEGEEVRALEAA